METHEPKFTNALIHESSPYLLQHAHNPVNWYAWNPITLAKALEEDKPMLISIGYSACHWCHVMERESFENEEIASVLNQYFICIKVDREERPDVDQVYMNALQMITGQGGWPLNMFALPDGSPFHGGTYFRPEDFKKLSEVVNQEFRLHRHKLETFAQKLKEGMQSHMQILENPGNHDFELSTIKAGVSEWKADFDLTWGGNTRTPKFPVPVSLKFLMAYAVSEGDDAMKEHVNRSLVRMARGGIYDQIGGGFARYSTDRYWKIPHFEKMLYDNGQLLELYASGLKWTGKNEYKRVIDDTVDWLEREMGISEGIWMSAMDADSEGEEGRFYVWESEELKSVLGEDYEWVQHYYNINKLGYWEENKYVLMRDASDEVMADELGMKPEELEHRIQEINNLLKKHRDKRVKPGIDDKCITSWNALTIMGLLECFTATRNALYFQMAQKSLEFLYQHQWKQQDTLYRSYKAGKATIPGFLDDYVFMAQAMERYYEVTLDSDWLERSIQLTKIMLQRFYSEQEDIFYYNSSLDQALIVRPVELYDNVIPSAYSAACELLWRLGHRTDRENWKEMARTSIRKMEAFMTGSLESFANWGRLYLDQVYGMLEISVVGSDAVEMVRQLRQYYIPFVLISGSTSESELPILKGKFQSGKNLIYVCKGQHCLAPVETVEEALSLI